CANSGLAAAGFDYW
nr:immunoglobulin heavy chain junction region [Macaca mulatta]MOW23170.1 immunoglobulin heavy chain junction region [Macaca mulatta]MOW23232.1 immunoglobulin heavy chain junction region [Macaca mulatta]MOW23259.1 immunoglobulin heavy chain junction region [Macaca mulatta]MOW23303.1 immunoglobulin heavy chain junction region [Macaca mulatta]